MPDEAEAAGDWSRPDGGIDPAEYVEEPEHAEAGAGQEPSSQESSAEADRPADSMSPGRSAVEDPDVDAVEPNEPA